MAPRRSTLTAVSSDTGFGDFEFERRFFARDVPADLLEGRPALLVQSYFLADEGYALRVRAQAPNVGPVLALGDDELVLLERNVEAVDFCAVTVKGPMVEGTRYEAEREIDVAVGVELIRRGGDRVAKLRHAVWLGEDGWVIDVFGGANAGLVIAEVERGGPVVDLAIPTFCVTEVTADPRLSNDSLARRPFAGWAQDYLAELDRIGPTFLSGFGHNRSL